MIRPILQLMAAASSVMLSSLWNHNLCGLACSCQGNKLYQEMHTAAVYEYLIYLCVCSVYVCIYIHSKPILLFCDECVSVCVCVQACMCVCDRESEMPGSVYRIIATPAISCCLYILTSASMLLVSEPVALWIQITSRMRRTGVKPV